MMTDSERKDIQWIVRNREDIHPSWFERIEGSGHPMGHAQSCEDLLIELCRVFGTGTGRPVRVYRWITQHKDATAFDATYRLGGRAAAASLVTEWANEQLAHVIRHERRRREARRTT